MRYTIRAHRGDVDSPPSQPAAVFIGNNAASQTASDPLTIAA